MCRKLMKNPNTVNSEEQGVIQGDITRLRKCNKQNMFRHNVFIYNVK